MDLSHSDGSFKRFNMSEKKLLTVSWLPSQLQAPGSSHELLQKTFKKNFTENSFLLILILQFSENTPT